MRNPDTVALEHLAVAVSRWNHPTVRELPPAARDTLADLIAESIRSAYPGTAPDSEGGRALRESGLYRFEKGLPLAHARAAEAYFVGLPCLNQHVEDSPHGDGVRRAVNGPAAEHAFGCYTRNEILGAPHLLEYFTSPAILDAAETFLGARPMIFSVNSFWAFPQPNASPYGQDFHRDKSHPRFCVLFVYLTDVDRESGPHQYIRYTQSPAALAAHTAGDPGRWFALPKDGYGFGADYLREFGHLVETIEGPAGTAFLSNAYGLHRGAVPTARRRLLAWARYSVFATPPRLSRTPAAALGARLPTDERARYALRGIVEF